MRKSVRVLGSECFPAQIRVVLLSVSIVGLSPSSLAQIGADAEMTAAHAPELLRLPKTAAHTVIRADMPARSITPEPIKVAISGFQVEGHPQISEQALADLLLPLKGKDLTLPEFEEHVHAVARYLRANGHPSATVSVSRSRLKEGVIAMAIQGLSPQTPEVISPTVLVKHFKVSGTSLASSEEFDALLEPWKDKPLTFAQLQELPVKVAGLLRDKGYVLAQAWLPPQRVDGGTLEITVVDGKVDGSHESSGIVVNGADDRIRPEVVRRYLQDSVTPDQPLMVGALDSALRRVGELPGVAAVKSTLIPGSQPGTTLVQVDVDEDKLVAGSVWANNFGDIYTGRGRLNAHVDLNSPTGRGEQFSLDISGSTGMKMAKVSGSMPYGSKGARVGMSAAHTTMDIDPTKVPANLDSESTVVSLFADYPLARSATRNGTLTGALDFKHFESVATGFQLDDRKIQMGTLAWSGNAIDGYGGLNAWSLGGSLGNLDLSGEPSYQAVDHVTAKTEGGFAKVNLEAGRLARISDTSWSYYTAFRGQLASKNLDSAEKFQLGGPSGVRAYPVGEGLGDDGWLATAELRRSMGNILLGEVEVFGFADVGGITQYHDPWSGALASGRPNTYTLSGAGLGASISGKRGSLSITAAHKIGSNPNPTAGNNDVDGTNDQARIWIIGNIVF